MRKLLNPHNDGSDTWKTIMRNFQRMANEWLSIATMINQIRDGLPMHCYDIQDFKRIEEESEKAVQAFHSLYYAFAALYGMSTAYNLQNLDEEEE